MNAERAAKRIRTAIQKNDVTWVEQYRDQMPWDRLFDPAFAAPELVSGLILRAGGHIEDGLLALIECAERDGRTEIFGTYESNGLMYAKPVLQLISARYDRLLRKYLEAGFDPEMRSAASGMNAFELAQRVGGRPEAEAMMRTFVTRRRVQSSLDALEAGAARPRPGGGA